MCALEKQPLLLGWTKWHRLIILYSSQDSTAIDHDNNRQPQEDSESWKEKSRPGRDHRTQGPNCVPTSPNPCPFPTPAEDQELVSLESQTNRRKQPGRVLLSLIELESCNKQPRDLLFAPGAAVPLAIPPLQRQWAEIENSPESQAEIKKEPIDIQIKEEHIYIQGKCSSRSQEQGSSGWGSTFYLTDDTSWEPVALGKEQVKIASQRLSKLNCH